MIKTRSKAIALALSGILIPGLHKFYLKQQKWGLLYLLLYPTYIPQVASMVEGVWYAWLSRDAFDQLFNPAIAQLRSDPTRPLRTAEDLQLATTLGITIDVNRATAKDWIRLPGISAAQGTLLTTLTQSGMSFHSLDDLAAALDLPVQQLQPLAPLLRFYYYDTPPLAPEDDTPGSLQVGLNPNQASLDELLSIPGLALSLGEKIIQQRERSPYQDLVDFKQRLSLSAEETAHLMYYIRFQDP